MNLVKYMQKCAYLFDFIKTFTKKKVVEDIAK